MEQIADFDAFAVKLLAHGKEVDGLQLVEDALYHRARFSREEEIGIDADILCFERLKLTPRQPILAFLQDLSQHQFQRTDGTDAPRIFPRVQRQFVLVNPGLKQHRIIGLLFRRVSAIAESTHKLALLPFTARIRSISAWKSGSEPTALRAR